MIRTARATLALAGCALLAACGAEFGFGIEREGVVTLRLAHIYEPSAPTHACGAAVMAEALADSDIRLQVYPGAQLGNEQELLEQLATGQLELAIAGPSFLAAWHAPVGVFDAAYVFVDTDHQIEAARSPLGQQLWDGLRDAHGIRVLDNWTYGSRHITSRRPIRHPDDLAGFRLRMPDARVWQESGRALGASPMPIAFAEVYLALQQGIADGQENPIPTIKAMGFHEVQTHINLTGHIQSSTQVVVSERIWQDLDPGRRDRLTDAARHAGDQVRACIDRADHDILDEWRRSGAVTVIDDIDREAFQDRARHYFASGFVWSDLYARLQRRDYGE